MKNQKQQVVRDDQMTEGLLLRLRRVEGQVRGLQNMVEQGRYCPDVLTQMSAVHESLRAVERMLLRSHLQNCATEALRSGDDRKAERTYEELTRLFYKHAR
jgi:DNA-binding FrmR family transcriptional regulator